MWANGWYLFKATEPDKRKCHTSSVRSRRRDLFELTGIYSLILLVIWTPRPWQWGMWAVAGVCIIGVIASSFDGWRTMGLCTENLRQSLWAVFLAAAIALLGIAVAGRLHTLRLPPSASLFIRHYGWYAIWAGLQQLILQCFFLARSIRLVPNTTAAAGLSASLFAV